MIAIMNIDEFRPRGIVIGRQVRGQGERPLSEAEHFFKRFPLCGGYVDMRDLVWCEDHQEPLPHPAGDRPQ